MNSTHKVVPVPVKAHTLGGKVFIEKPQILEDVILSSIEQHPRKYRTEKFTPNGTSRSRSPKLDRTASRTDHFDMLKARKDTGPELTYEKEKRDKMFPVLLQRVDDASNFLNTVEKEMILFNEAKNNKIRRQFEDWNVNVHGKIQVRVFILSALPLFYLCPSSIFRKKSKSK
jgi:hypothetical protein